MNRLHLCAVICSFSTVLVHIFSLSSVLWVYGDMYFFGLWSICIERECTSYGMSAKVYIHVTRAFMLMSTTTGVTSCFFLFVAFYYPIIRSVSLTAISLIPSLLAGSWNFIAMATFTIASIVRGFISDRRFSIAFFLGWVTVPLYFVVAALASKLAIEEREKMANVAAASSR